jgi:hypothetical protein
MQQFDGGGRLYGIRRHEAVRALSAREHGSGADVRSARAGQVARQLAEYDRRACQPAHYFFYCQLYRLVIARRSLIRCYISHYTNTTA